MQILSPGPGGEELTRILVLASEAVTSSKVIVYPTDTIYGLGVNPFDKEAMSLLIELKGRDAGKPISIGLADASRIPLIAEVDETAQKIIDNFLPGPLTLVLKNLDKRLDWETIGIRVPSHPLALSLYEACGPLTATSANLSNHASSNDINAIASIFGNRVSLYVEGELPAEVEASTVVECIEGKVRILREGVISENDILRVLEHKNGPR